MISYDPNLHSPLASALRERVLVIDGNSILESDEISRDNARVGKSKIIMDFYDPATGVIRTETISLEIMPVANPAMMFVAAPVEDCWTMSKTGFLPNPV